MNKTLKRNVVVSAVLAIVLCASLITGATFALFTSESEANIAVTAGNVNVVAYVDEKTVETKSLQAKEYEIGKDHMYEAEATFEAGSLTLTKMLPGDAIKFDIIVKNKSDVTVKYRTILTCEGELFEGVNVKINGEDNKYDGLTRLSDWTVLDVNADPDNVSVEIEFPAETEENQNKYQGKTLKLSYIVEAVQGNATKDNDENAIYIYTVNDLIAFANDLAHYVPGTGNVNLGNIYAGKTVYLMNDLDLEGSSFNGIGSATIDQYNNSNISFCGTFDGQGHIISNMTVSANDPAYASAGLFNVLGTATVKNVIVSGATVNSTHYAGGIVGYGNGMTIVNCHVINSTVTSTPEQVGTLYDNGDKVGGIAGYVSGKTTIDNCTVKSTELCGYRDIGGIVGCADGADCSVKNNEVLTDVAVINNVTHAGSFKDNAQPGNIDSIVGRNKNNATVTGNTGTIQKKEATFVSTAAGLYTALHKGGNVIITGDIDMTTTDWTPVKVDTENAYQQIAGTLCIDGKGHAIIGLNHSLIGAEAARYITVRNLTIKDSNINGVGNQNNTNCGAFVSYLDGFNYGLTLYNCHTVNVDVTATADANNLDGTGIGAGSLVGYNGASNATISISNCTVTGGSVTNTNGNAAGIIGMWQLGGDVTIANCKVTGCIINGEKNIKTGGIVGTVNGSGTLTIENCTYSDCTTTIGFGCGKYGRIVQPEHGTAVFVNEN